jgi:hypothetical protein
MAKPVPMVRPRTIAEIEAIAQQILERHSPRTLVGERAFPILDYIDGPLFEEYGVDYDVQDLGPSVEGKLEGHTLVLNTCVYQGMLRNQSRDRFTGAHETGHAVLHAGQLAVMNDSARGQPTLYRQGEIKPFLNPEWQANTFAAAILMPLPGVRMVLSTVARRDLMSVATMIAARFQVSEQAAEIRVRKLVERGAVML